MKELIIQSLIDYIEKTTDDQWLMGRVRTKDNKQNCIMGHVFDWGGGDEKHESGCTQGSEAWDWFENCWATTYMIYPVNDGEDKRYKQKTCLSEM